MRIMHVRDPLGPYNASSPIEFLCWWAACHRTVPPSMTQMRRRGLRSSVCHARGAVGSHVASFAPGLAEGTAEFTFATGELRSAGQYTATAEWDEGRAELAHAHAKRDALVRSTALTFMARSRWVCQESHGRTVQCCPIPCPGCRV